MLSESPTTSPLQPDCRHYSLRAHLRPPLALSRRSSAGLGKTHRGVPKAGHRPERRVLAWVGRRLRPRLLPRPWRSEEKGRNAGRIPGAQGRTCRQEVPCVHCPSDASHSGANAWIGAGALPPFGWGAALNLPRPPGGGGSGESVPSGLLPGPRSFHPSAVRTGAGVRCSRVSTHHLRYHNPTPGSAPPFPVRPGFGTSGCPLASLASTCPGRRA